MNKFRISVVYPIFVLVFIFFVFVFNFIKEQYIAFHSLNHLKEKIVLSTKISNIVHTLQIERGLSVASLVDKNDAFLLDLERQRKSTDKIIKILDSSIAHILDKKALEKIRENVDSKNITSSEVLSFYSQLNSQFLSGIVVIAQNSISPDITKALTSYSNFLFSKELLGIERAIGTEIISSTQLNAEQILYFYALIVRQNEYKNNIFKYAPDSYENSYKKLLSPKIENQIKKFESIILSKNREKIKQINSQNWFKLLTYRIDDLTELEKYFANDIIALIEGKLQEMKNDFIFNMFLSVLGLFLFTFISLYILKIRKNEQKLQLLTDKYLISSTTDKRGVITAVSQAFVKISGYDKSELIGKPHNIVRHSDMSSSVFEEVWKTIQSGKIWNGEIKNRKKNGNCYWTKSSIIPNYDARNNIISYTSLRHDITSEKSKEEFMANMSHELRTPLNAIIGFSDLLAKKLHEEENLEFIHRIGISAKVLLKLINDILDLSKITDSKFSVEPYEFNAYDEINEYSEIFTSLTSQKNITLEKHIDENLNAIYLGDWVRISQIILNIISNAVKFTPDGGEIKFHANYKNEKLLLIIEDNGIGMAKDVHEKIFQPFEQADGSTTRKYGGTGLGLSITQNLVEHMQGSIEVESTEGIGSLFRVCIPLPYVKKSIDTLSVKEEEDETFSFNDHILVAEDNISNQILIEELLKDFKITCDIANDGEEAVAMYDPSKHSFILMDENMPNLNGLKAMQLLKEKYKDECPKIIALTANTMSGDKERFLKLGMDDYLSKPIEMKELQKVLAKYAKKAASTATAVVEVDYEHYFTKAMESTQEKTKFPQKIITKLIVSYYKGSLTLLDSLKNAIENNDLDAISRATHDLKSSSYMLNYTLLGEMAESAEHKALKNEEFDYLNVYNIFSLYINELRAFIETLDSGYNFD